MEQQQVGAGQVSRISSGAGGPEDAARHGRDDDRGAEQSSEEQESSEDELERHREAGNASDQHLRPRALALESRGRKSTMQWVTSWLARAPRPCAR